MELDGREDINDEGMNKNWERITTANNDSSKTCLGCRQQRPKEWMLSDTWKAIESRRRLKKKLMDSKSQQLKERHQDMYWAANKEVKRRTRADKRALHPRWRRQLHAMSKVQCIRSPRL